MKYWLSLTLISIVSFNSLGQDFELAGVRYVNYPTAKANNTGSSEFSIKEFGGFFNIPTILDADSTSVMLNGLGYAQIRINLLDGSLPVNEDQIILHSVNYRFSFVRKFNSKWIFIGLIEPSLASDFKSKLSSDDLVIQSLAIVSKKINSKLFIGGGLAYTARFGYPRILPLISMKYTSKKHRINALLPTKLMYAYHLNAKIDIGLKAIINGANFNITGYSNDFIELNKLNYTRGNIGPILYYKPRKRFSIELSGGISTNRTFRLVDIDNNTYNNTASTEAFVNIGLVIKPFTSK